MKCSIEGCPGEYKDRKIVYTVRCYGKVVVIDHVPAEVCSVCGDVPIRQRQFIRSRNSYERQINQQVWFPFMNTHKEAASQ